METIKETLETFLSEELRQNPDFIQFAEKPLPPYIQENLNTDKKLRPYQELAIKTFIYFWENNDIQKCRHLLFNMATGTGKTLVMACCILFLYTKGYRKFIFFVSSVQILDQARKGFTQSHFKKYLFSKKITLLDENNELQNVLIKRVDIFSSKKNSKNIEIIFDTIQGLSSKINESRENQIEEKDFEKEKIVFLADEAHHLNSATKWKKTKTEKEEENTWEDTIMRIFGKHNEHILLEFTATIDIKDAKIREKYQNKLLYRYDFAMFRNDRYCKEIQTLESPRTNTIDATKYNDGVEPQKRLTIINALVLSEYRKIIFKEVLGRDVNPIILFKSANISTSRKDMEDVLSVISHLQVDSLDYLKELRYKDSDEYGIIAGMFDFLENHQIHIQGLIASIKQNFRQENMIIYNSKTKTTTSRSKSKKEEEKYITDSLAKLDDENSKIRAVFIVQALREWWDVLSLYDLVHFDLSDSKKVEASDIQLVGRGARYFPFVLPEEFNENTEQMWLFSITSNDMYRRKFDNSNMVDNHLALLETFYYHFIEEKNFAEKLRKELMMEGLIPDGGQLRELKIKETFKVSETYKNGFVLVNFPEKRQKPMSKIEEEKTFGKTLIFRDYKINFTSITNDKEKNADIAGEMAWTFCLTEEYGFNYWLLNWALYYYKNKFFRLQNLQKHITELIDIREFIEKFLPKYTISYFYKDGKTIEKLSADTRVDILQYVILPQIEESIDTNLPKIVGGKTFRPRSIKEVFQEVKTIYVGGNDNERSRGQNNHPEYHIDLIHADWYSHNENYGTTDEKKFVQFIAWKIPHLKARYPNSEIFLMRNELDFYIHSFENGEKFSPDFVLFINDFESKTLYYQCLFEVKWSHLRTKDKWKENALKSIEKFCEISFQTTDNEKYQKYLDSVAKEKYKEIKNIGFGFYTANSPDDDEDTEYKFLSEFDEKLL